MSKKGYYLEVTVPGRAKVWVSSEKEPEEFLSKDEFYRQAAWEEEESAGVAAEAQLSK